MKKIGVFLSAEPSFGGMFQYSHAVLNAIAELPQGAFSLVVAYADRTWEKYLPPGHLLRLPVYFGCLQKSIAKFSTLISPEICWKWTRGFNSLVRRIVAERCDLWIFPRQDIWSTQFPVPTLIAVHDLMHRYESRFPEVSSFGRAWYRDSYIERACTMAKGIMVDSELGRAHVQESYGTSLNKIFVLPYIPELSHQSEFEPRLQLPEKFVFYPAQFWEHKNHANLLEAIAIVKQTIPEVKLVLAGSKKHRYRRAVSKVTELGLSDDVSFLGFVSSTALFDIYSKARALIFPSFFGPTNIPPLEALAIGCPAAVSRIYGMPTQLEDAVLYFNPSSPEEIADCISRLWKDDDLCRELSAKGKFRSSSWGRREFRNVLHHIIYRCVAPFDAGIDSTQQCQELNS